MMLFNGSNFDSTIAAIRGRITQERSLQRESMKLLSTQSGVLRILDTAGQKPPLLIVPDGPCSIEHYLDLIDLLSPDFRVICFDLPGFGFSYPAWGYDFSVAKTADTIVEVMDLLNIPFAALAFTCANGFFALHIAKYYPDRVSHLVLGQTPSFESMRQWNERIIPKILHVPYVGQIMAASLTRKMAAGWYKKALPKNSPHTEQFIQCADRVLESGGCFCLASLVQGLSHTRSTDLADISTPTLLIYGDKDRSHNQTDFTSLRTHAPRAEIIQFQGCGHFPDLERPPEYAQQIASFIRANG
jgi:pimeloyl-ACP methyl ester carboxylesterase